MDLASANRGLISFGEPGDPMGVASAESCPAYRERALMDALDPSHCVCGGAPVWRVSSASVALACHCGARAMCQSPAVQIGPKLEMMKGLVAQQWEVMTASFSAKISEKSKKTGCL